MTVDLKNIVQKDQIERMQRGIEEAAKRCAAEKRALELEITTWRDKLADMSERLFAAEAVKTRQAARIARLRECLEWLDRRGGLGLDVHERIKPVTLIRCLRLAHSRARRFLTERPTRRACNAAGGVSQHRFEPCALNRRQQGRGVALRCRSALCLMSLTA
jgi:hypothetical protein